jgi:hypothetical protein
MQAKKASSTIEHSGLERDERLSRTMDEGGEGEGSVVGSPNIRFAA